MTTKNKVLVVDDDIASREILEAKLIRLGYEVSGAASGNEAMSLLEQNPPDLIVSDIIMKDMDGFAFCASIRTNPRYNSIPLLFLSVRKEVPDIVRGLRQGADGYLSKPVHLSELAAKIEALLRFRERCHLEPEKRNSAKDDSSARTIDIPVPEPVRNIVLEGKEKLDRDATQIYEVGLESFEEGEYDRALNTWRGLLKKYPEHEGLKKEVDRAKNQLFNEVLGLIGSLEAVLFSSPADQRESSLSLKADEGYVYSMADGTSSVGDIVKTCNLDRYETLRILAALVRKGYLRVRS